MSIRWFFRNRKTRDAEAKETKAARRKDGDIGYIGMSLVKVIGRVGVGNVMVEYVASGDTEMVAEESIKSYPTSSR